MTYTQMLFALIFDKAIFGHNPSLTSLVGSVMIVTSAMYIAFHKASLKRRAEEEKERQQTGNGSVHMTEVRRSWSTPRTGSTLVHVQDEEQGLVEGIDANDGGATESEYKEAASRLSRRSSLR